MTRTIAAIRPGSGRPDPGAERMRRALDAIASGRPVVVVDDEDREDEGDLIVAAQLVTPATTAFSVRHTSGFVCGSPVAAGGLVGRVPSSSLRPPVVAAVAAS